MSIVSASDLIVHNNTQNLNPINKSVNSYSQTEIIDSAVKVKKYTEDYKKIPSRIQIGSNSINMAQFVHLSTSMVVAVNNKNNAEIYLYDDILPSYSVEQLTNGNLSKLEYVELARTISLNMNSNHQAHPYVTSKLGKIGFQSQVYLFARILSSYKDNQTLPSSIPIRNWTYYSTIKFSQQEIIDAAKTTNAYVETQKNLPSNITIGKHQISVAQLLQLMSSTIIALNNQDSQNIILLNIHSPLTSQDKLISGRLTKTEYLDLSEELLIYLDKNKMVPQYTHTRLGNIGYQSLVYLYTRLLNDYDYKKTLPRIIYMKTWDPRNIPIANQPITFQPKQIINSAIITKLFIESNKSLPQRVRIGNEYINTSQLLHLMASTLLQIKENNWNPLVLTYDKTNYDDQENMIFGYIKKTQYLDFTINIKTYMDSKLKAPSILSVGAGFESQVYLLSKILDTYKKTSTIPDKILLKPLKPSMLLGSSNLGKVERIGPYGNVFSPIKIAYIVGMHSLEHVSHQSMMDMIITHSSSLNYCYYFYKITVTKDPMDYTKGRLNGQILGKEYVAKDIIKHKFNLAVDVHSNRGTWAKKRFILCPVVGTAGERIAKSLVNKLPWLSYYIPPNPTSPIYVTIPVIKGGIPAICYEIFIEDTYSQASNLQYQFIKTLDSSRL